MSTEVLVSVPEYEGCKCGPNGLRKLQRSRFAFRRRLVRTSASISYREWD